MLSQNNSTKNVISPQVDTRVEQFDILKTRAENKTCHRKN